MFSGFALRKDEIQPYNFRITFRKGANLVVQTPKDNVAVLLTDTNEDPRTAQQRQVVELKFELSVKRGCIVKLVSLGADGSFGQVITLSFVNEDQKYEVTPLSQQNIFDREYKFVYPQDKDALEVLLTSIMKEVIDKELVSEEEARKLLKDLAKQIKNLY